MATWPVTLPDPQVSGYRLDPRAASLRSDMESGAARARRITSARDDRVAASWIFTDAEMATFRTWFDDDDEAAGGAAWFTVSLCIGTTGAVSCEARFVGPWSSGKLSGGLWQVSGQLEVRDV